MHTARNATSRIVPGATFGRGSARTTLEKLWIVPIVGDSRPLDVLSLRRGMLDRVTISERRAGATVSRVSVATRSNLPIMLLCREDVVGCRNNRILRRTLQVAPGDDMEAPVLLVEQGRSGEQYSHGLRYRAAAEGTYDAEPVPPAGH